VCTGQFKGGFVRMLDIMSQHCSQLAFVRMLDIMSQHCSQLATSKIVSVSLAL
jgi:hypothetical protein